MPLSPLNDRLRFVTEAGQIDDAAIDADLLRRAAEMQRRSRKPAASASGWSWRSPIYTFADGELQLWEMRKLARDQGLQSVSDLIAPVAVGPFNVNDNHDDYDAVLTAVQQAMGAPKWI